MLFLTNFIKLRFDWTDKEKLHWKIICFPELGVKFITFFGTEDPDTSFAEISLKTSISLKAN